MSVTRQEQREARCAAGPAETPRRRRAEQSGETYTGLIASWAKRRAGEKLNNLVRFFSVENLRRACGELKGTKAVGGDGMTKGKYVEFLEENLQELYGRMRRMAYRPEAARRVLIPKPDGSKRPIAVSNFEDKIVQKVAADILTAIYDREFKRFSFGFRSGRSCHGAVGYLFNRLRKRNHCWVVDIDLKDFFGTIDHGKLMDVLGMRISDKRLLRYLWRMLKAGILIEGNCFEQEQGTPQGSIVSPVLANIYSAVIWNLFRWLNRRSQKESYTWEGFQMRLKSKPLPLPTEGPKLIDLTDPMLYCA